ncbi:hypothetical protein C0Q70_09912 [Pomacea canaliculata]|uniref:G-protein coupled receptors family 2 profile 2 domain-containing protein n=1 Tax=Pomacea canaliculata TaxID=400727 RepID=A0A2T7PB51_POMCA|nr:hypothetical protein C0Q70_09912 [Pomacea canaliculata]
MAKVASGRSLFYSTGIIIQAEIREGFATKSCRENGTWYTNPESSQEWTDYTTCVQLDHFEALFWVSVVCNIFSLVLLLPACFIFLYFRSLRHQHRIKLHLCLFSSYVFTSGVMLLWESLVVSDRLYRDTNDTIMHQNSAFAVPRSLVGFYIGGFCEYPRVPPQTGLHGVLRSVYRRCWVHNAGEIEWIIYVPILFCIAGNVFFLGKILWVMLNQLQSHPNEPSSYRRAVKAAAILIPLFGLQALLVMIRPSTSSFAFEVISRIVSSTQV